LKVATRVAICTPDRKSRDFIQEKIVIDGTRDEQTATVREEKNKMEYTGKKRVRLLRVVRHNNFRHNRGYGVPAYRMLRVTLGFICYVLTAGCVYT